MGGRAAQASARRRDRAPLPPRDGLAPVRLRVDDALVVRADAPTAMKVLLARFPPLGEDGATPLGERFAVGEVLAADGTAWAAEDPVGEGDELWFHRELRAETVEPVDLPVLLRDDHLLVIDKPHGIATMPRGAHVLGSALVRLRRETGLADLSPLHRLDRGTAGVLAFGIVPGERGAYQTMFARSEVRKKYRAQVHVGEHGRDLLERTGGRTRIAVRLEAERDPSGLTRSRVVAGEPNSLTEVEVLTDDGDRALLSLRPHTGRMHQLRAHLAHVGLPVLGDGLYGEPASPEAASEHGEGRLQLLARELAFTDPVTGQERRVVSARTLER